MKNAYFRLSVNLAGPVEIGIYETPVNLVLMIVECFDSRHFFSFTRVQPNRLAAETFKTINMDRRLKRKHPADLTNDMTQRNRGWYPAGGSHLHVNITVKKFYQMSKLDKLRIQIINKKKKKTKTRVILFYVEHIEDLNFQNSLYLPITATLEFQLLCKYRMFLICEVVCVR